MRPNMSRGGGFPKMCRSVVSLLASAFLLLPSAAWACVGVNGTVPPWGGSGPNKIMAAKILAANRAAQAKGLQAPPIAPISGAHPAVIILIHNPGAGVTFGYPGSTLWSDRLSDIDAYYNEVSRGALRITKAAETHGTANDGVIGPVTVTGLSTTSSITYENSLSIGVTAIRAANPYINYAAFDTDGSGTVDPDELHILIYQAGDEASYYTSSPPEAWAHNIGNDPVLQGLTPSSDSDGKRITSYCYCGSEFEGAGMATMGQMTHELGHDIGLPDEYDVDGNYTGGHWSGLGYHSLMSGGSWGSVAGGTAGDTPVHLDGFLKSWLGWASVTTVTAPGNRNVTLDAANGNNEVVKIIPSVATDQFFIVENRQQTGFDAGLPGSAGGLAVFHCDGAILTDENMRLLNAINMSSSNFGIAIEQANGALDLLTTSTSAGADTDYFRVGVKTSFNASTAPSSNLKNGAASGVDINTISASASAMTFKLGTPPPGPAAGLSPKTYTVGEVGGSATVTVVLDHAPDAGNTFSVNYATSNGTATAGADYVAASGTLTFSDNETSKTFVVTLIDDGAIESTESFGIVLSGAVGGSIDASSATGTITITDDDVDTDGDRITDYNEIHAALGYVTDPLLQDTDGDGVNDDLEIVFGYDPTLSSSVPELGFLGVPLFR